MTPNLFVEVTEDHAAFRERYVDLPVSKQPRKLITEDEFTKLSPEYCGNSDER